MNHYGLGRWMARGRIKLFKHALIAEHVIGVTITEGGGAPQVYVHFRDGSPQRL